MGTPKIRTTAVHRCGVSGPPLRTRLACHLLRTDNASSKQVRYSAATTPATCCTLETCRELWAPPGLHACVRAYVRWWVVCCGVRRKIAGEVVISRKRFHRPRVMVWARGELNLKLSPQGPLTARRDRRPNELSDLLAVFALLAPTWLDAKRQSAVLACHLSDREHFARTPWSSHSRSTCLHIPSLLLLLLLVDVTQLSWVAPVMNYYPARWPALSS